MKFVEILEALYIKNNRTTEIDNGYLIVINKWLSWNKDNVESLAKILKYLFYIEPIHYYYLLYFNIPKKYRTVWIKNPEKKKEEYSELILKIQEVLGWSNKELSFNLPILEKTVLKNKKYWKSELGLK